MKEKMFKVEIHLEGKSWYGINFEFDSVEEAQKFIQTALSHFIKKDDDEDDSKEDVLIASIRYSQEFTTAEEEKTDADS